ncbi:TIGR02234 family membrane protein [Gordonia sp. PKS22-38]|uniref:TIGR02234 family membrane protein n=1 Tax=Gordonia prachuapensis TaxID=3115651 RepID=A0ABU7MS06_9ACTN|nr:TIGR02234 family membrane protein [Gordonia sp. PKS22-38]
MTASDDPSASGSVASPTVSEAATKSYLRRRQMLAAVLLAASALALWSASRLVWCRVLASDGLAPPRTFEVKGADWSPWLTPLALVLLAAILAAFSIRGWGLRLLAILIAAAGVLSAIPALSLIIDGAESGYAAEAAEIPGRFQPLLITTNSWAAAVVLVGAVCAVMAGILLLRVAGGASGMSSKYQTPGARRAELERQIFAEHERRTATRSDAAGTDGHEAGTTGSDPNGAADRDTAATPAAADGNEEPTTNERMMWDALDTGIDPTDVDDSSGPDATPDDPEPRREHGA